MRSYVVAPQAEEDLKHIWRYLLMEVGLELADRIQSELLHTFEGLAEVPGKGHKRSDLTGRSVLFFSLYQYLIVYRPDPVVEIVAVLHGRRNMKRLLKTRLNS